MPLAYLPALSSDSTAGCYPLSSSPFIGIVIFRTINVSVCRILQHLTTAVLILPLDIFISYLVTKDQFARDDPAFLVLLSLALCCMSRVQRIPLSPTYVRPRCPYQKLDFVVFSFVYWLCLCIRTWVLAVCSSSPLGHFHRLHWCWNDCGNSDVVG